MKNLALFAFAFGFYLFDTVIITEKKHYVNKKNEKIRKKVFCLFASSGPHKNLTYLTAKIGQIKFYLYFFNRVCNNSLLVKLVK